MATSPTPITPLPTPVPQRSDPANFAARGDALMTALPALVTETNAVGVITYNNAVEASTAATTAIGAATDATSASTVALAAANFKGEWPSLTGAINKPASVKHEGRFWLLLNNLANVASSEPGSTADWTSLDAGQVSTRVTSSGDTPMVAGVLYCVTVSGVRLVAPLPVNVMQNDTFSASGVYNGTYLVSWNGNTVKGDTQSIDMTIPVYSNFKVTSDGVTLA